MIFSSLLTSCDAAAAADDANEQIKKGEKMNVNKRGAFFARGSALIGGRA